MQEHYPLPPHILPPEARVEALKQDSFISTYVCYDPPRLIKHLSFKDLDNWKAKELFERESQILKQLSHKNIPTLLQTYELPNGDCGLVYEYIDAQSLEEWINSQGPLPEKLVLKIGKKICKVLKYLHNHQPAIIHRDIRPDHILVNIVNDELKALYLTHFGSLKEGISHMVQDTQGSTIVGSFGYAPLEQYARKAFPSSDLYSLGMTLVFALSGKSPQNIPKKNLVYQFDSLIDVTPGFLNALKKMTHPEPEKRFPKAQQVHELFKQCSKDTSPWNKLAKWTHQSNIKLWSQRGIVFLVWIFGQLLWATKLGRFAIDSETFWTFSFFAFFFNLLISGYILYARLFPWEMSKTAYFLQCFFIAIAGLCILFPVMSPSLTERNMALGLCGGSALLIYALVWGIRKK